jgi:fumarylpyruvate hydrolase
MNEYGIAPPPAVPIPVVGGKLFPVRRVFYVGRNYAVHVREIGSDPDRQPPFFL